MCVSVCVWVSWHKDTGGAAGVACGLTKGEAGVAHRATDEPGEEQRYLEQRHEIRPTQVKAAFLSFYSFCLFLPPFFLLFDPLANPG